MILHFAATALGILLVLVVLLDSFETVVLPRTVRRGGRISNYFFLGARRIFARVGRLRKSRGRQGFLFAFAPTALLALIVLWAVFMIVGWALIHWGIRTSMGPGSDDLLTTDLYFSGVTFFTLGYGDVVPIGGVGRTMAVVEAGQGFGFLALVVSYIPVLYSAFSRREVQILLLDSRAGSEPMGLELLHRHATDGCMGSLVGILRDWERFGAELLESYLSYPLLAFYRSQHDNQSWLKSLTAIMDACALIEVGFEGEHDWAREVRFQARATFSMARHVVVDLAYVLECPPFRGPLNRLTPPALLGIRHELANDGLLLKDGPESEARLEELRAMYEPYAEGLAARMALDLPKWCRKEALVDNWQTSAWEGVKHF